MTARETRAYVLITGATSGIGVELARVFASEGRHLILVARLQDRLDEVREELAVRYGVDVQLVAADLFEPDAAQFVFDTVRGHGWLVDTLVNDAGQGEHGKFAETDLGRQIDVVQLNVVALMSLTHLFMQDMIVRGRGRILQLGSLVSRGPAPLLAVYAATKAFVLSFGEAVANELEGTGVTMTVLMPGATDTDFFLKAGSERSRVYAEGKLADPAQVARDGYEALMAGKTTVTSGLANKAKGLMQDLLPHARTAARMRAENEEIDAPRKEARREPTHPDSKRDRDAHDRH